MGATAQLRFSPLPSSLSPSSHFHSNTNRQFSYLTNPNNTNNNRFLFCNNNDSSNLSILLRSSLSLASPSGLKPCLSSAVDGGGSLGGTGGGGGGGGGFGSGSGGTNNNGGSGWDNDDSSSSSGSIWEKLGILGIFIKGWQSRVAADPQFPFKVLMEELVGVTACVLGDMASRPNFGLNELDFVFSTLVVGSILNFTLMYLLAPTAGVAAAAGASSSYSIFANCPKSHMFEPGHFSLLSRCGTFVYKGAVFAAVGFAAGLVGTALSNGLLKVRKKMDPAFETPNKAPPTLLNAVTWAAHMGLSSNLRYQTLNGVEYALERAMPSGIFKTSVVALRCANNVLGGMSFVVLARLTGSQGAQPTKLLDADAEEDAAAIALEGEEDKLRIGGVGAGAGLESNQQPATTTTSSAH